MEPGERRVRRLRLTPRVGPLANGHFAHLRGHWADIGFVQPGQLAEVKLETFTRFGHVPGEAVSVSGDAIADERRGLVYTARIRLLQQTIAVNGLLTPPVPGMTATAAIRTGSRRVSDYLLSPLARYGHEAMWERC